VSNNLQAARETALAQPENVIAAEQVAYLEALQSAVAN
jgi:hypothetical protein